MTTAEILADLGRSDELTGAIANLEGLFFAPLDGAIDLNPIKKVQLAKTRDLLALAQDSIAKLAA